MTGSLLGRLVADMHAGMSVRSLAAKEGISLSLAEVMVDDLERRGALAYASSLCASGLGACSGGKTVEASVACAGCPLARG